jgi:hypothetical protein
MEQYREGRSAAWYWRQVLAAIAAGATQDVIGHKVIALRALVVGLTLYILFAVPVAWLSTTVQGRIESGLIGCGPQTFWCQFFSNPFSAQLLVYSVCALSGWIVAKLHRRQAVGAVWVYSAGVLLLEYGTLAWLLTAYPPPEGAPWVTIMVVSLVSTLPRPMAVLAGGLWGARNPSRAPVVSLD